MIMILTIITEIIFKKGMIAIITTMKTTIITITIIIIKMKKTENDNNSNCNNNNSDATMMIKITATQSGVPFRAESGGRRPPLHQWAAAAASLHSHNPVLANSSFIGQYCC